jgi:hypothetical protein
VRTEPTRCFEIAALAVVGIAAALRLWGLDAGLPHLMTRPDEELIVFQTRLPASGVFDLEWPGLHPGIPSAYIFLLWIWGEMGLPILQLMGAAPAGDYILALQEFPDRLLLTERFFSACAGTATVAVLIWVARREFGSRTAILAGLILAVSVFHVRDSHSAKSDIALGLFSILALGLLAPLARDLTRRGAVVAGLSIGMAMAMKLPGVLLMLPAWVACAQGSRRTGWRRMFPFEIFLLGSVAVAFFVATSPDFVFNAETAERIMAIPGLAFPQLSGSTVSDAAGVAGSASPREWPGFLYHSQFSLRYAIGLPAVLLLPVALVWGAFSRRSLATLCVIFFVTAYLVFGASTALLSRYMTPLLPVAALLVAALVVAGLELVVAKRSRLGDLGLLVCALVLLQEPLVASLRFDRLMAVEDTRVTANEWMQDHTVRGDRIALAGAALWFWGDPQIPRGREILRPGLQGDALHRVAADFLVVHDHVLFSSVADWDAVAALGSSARLVAEFDPVVEGAGPVIYEPQDAFYLPTRGFAAVRAPGPLIRIYSLREP